MQNNAAIVTMALSVASFMRPPEPLILAQKQASRKTLETPGIWGKQAVSDRFVCESVTYRKPNGTLVTRRGKPDNFDEKWIPEPMSGCWIWLAGTTNTYGEYRGNRAHRVSYERKFGPIPDGLHIDHKCRNRLCVNPDHLEAVTCAENIRRGNAGLHRRAERAAVAQCRNGHEYTAANTYIFPRTGARVCRACRNACERRRTMKRSARLAV